MATRKKKNNIGAFGHPIYGKGFAKYGEMRPNGSSEIPKDLEEAANNYASVTDPEAHGINFIREVFIAGAEWQKEQDEKEQADLFTIVALDAAQRAKEQMMKNAVECIVENWNPDPEPEITIPLNPEEFTCGDKVRVIVLPKND